MRPAPEPSSRLWIAIVILGACARLVPHPWNFTPLIAIGLFSGVQARHFWNAILATLLGLALSDAVLGFYHGFLYIYAAALVPVLLGRLIQGRTGRGWLSAGVLASSLSFFIITNFVVWATGSMYPHSSAGLAACFVAGIPFYGNQLMGDAFYSLAMFGGYAFLFRRYVRPAQQAA